jgi:hypothetical protein
MTAPQRPAGDEGRARQKAYTIAASHHGIRCVASQPGPLALRPSRGWLRVPAFGYPLRRVQVGGQQPRADPGQSGSGPLPPERHRQ